MRRLRRRKLGEILIADGLIQREQLDEALAVQKQTGESVGEILVREGMITESDVVRSICSQYQLPFLRPTAYAFDEGLMDAFTSNFLFIHRILPLEAIGHVTIVAVSEIPSQEVEQKLQETLGKEPYFYVASAAEICQILINHFQMGQELVMSLEQERRNMRRTAGYVPRDPSRPTPGAPLPPGSPSAEEPAGASGLDDSWEAIFDEAEKNL